MGQSRVRTEATALTSSQPSTARVHWVSAMLVILLSKLHSCNQLLRLILFLNFFIVYMSVSSCFCGHNQLFKKKRNIYDVF